MTEIFQAVILAPLAVMFPSLATTSAAPRLSFSTGLAQPSRQTSVGSAEAPLAPTAVGGASGNDFFGQLIDANLHGALYEVISLV